MATRLKGTAKRPRLLHIVADGSPGGGTTVVLSLIDDLLKENLWQSAILSQPGSFIAGEAAQRGVQFFGLNLFTSLADPMLPWRLHRILRGESFELSHLHGLRSAHTAVRWPARRRLGRLVYTVHGLHQFHQSRTIQLLANVVERQVMRRADERIFVSQADWTTAYQNELMPPGRPGRVIYNGIDAEILGRFAQPRRDIDLLFLGRHVPQKQPDVAARVLARLAAAGYRCVLAGGGPLHQTCIELLKTVPGGAQVGTTGELTHVEALGWLARAKVLLMPSQWEGMPIVAIEAAALGVAVVATRLPGLEEVLADGVTALLPPPGDEQALVDAALRLLQDDALRQALQAAASRHVLRHFDRRSTSAAYLALYRQLIEATA